MRTLAIAALVGALASCAAPQPYQPSPRAARELDVLLAGKVAQKPLTCLPNYNSNDMQIVDGRTVAFKLGSHSVYVMRLSPGCELLGGGGYALLTKQSGGMGTCNGDIARVFDTTTSSTVGSCGVESITPYTRPDR